MNLSKKMIMKLIDFQCVGEMHDVYSGDDDSLVLIVSSEIRGTNRVVYFKILDELEDAQPLLNEAYYLDIRPNLNDDGLVCAFYWYDNSFHGIVTAGADVAQFKFVRAGNKKVWTRESNTLSLFGDAVPKQITSMVPTTKNNFIITYISVKDDEMILMCACVESEEGADIRCVPFNYNFNR